MGFCRLTSLLRDFSVGKNHPEGSLTLRVLDPTLRGVGSLGLGEGWFSAACRNS